MARTLGIYWAFARVRFADLLANRTRFVVGVLTYVIYISVFNGIYQAVYQSGGSVGDFSLNEALSYVAVAWLLRSLYTNRLDEELTQEVRQGSVALSLLRPVDLSRAKVAAALGEAGFRALAFTLPAALLVVFLYPLELPTSSGAGLRFAASAFLSLLVYTQLNLLVGLTAVFTEHTLGIQRAKRAMTDLFGGVLLPLSVFPDWAQTALTLSPFQAVAYAPLQLYLGKASPLQVYGTQAFWVVTLYIVSRLVWRRAVTTLTVQGG